MKIELWNGHKIRFVEHEGEWWAVAKDVADALDYSQASAMTKKINKKFLVSSKLEDMNAKVILISEFGIYKAIFNSHKPNAEEFQEWVFNIIKTLRQSAGLEGFQMFRMLDIKKQNEMMSHLQSNLRKPVRKDFIKANVIANKAVSNKYGHPKMLKKDQMTPEMLKDRQPILDDTVHLMIVKDRFNLSLSVSDEVYKMIFQQNHNASA